MAKSIQIIVDNEIIQRKDDTGRTHEEIYMTGLDIIEKQIREDAIDPCEGAETVG